MILFGFVATDSQGRELNRPTVMSDADALYKCIMEIAEIKHMLLHALTEDELTERLDKAKSQQEVYNILQELSYFTLTMEEFKQGIEALQSEEA